MFNTLKTPNRGPSPFLSWPLPLPLPQREGRDHRGYPSFAACVVMRVWFHLDAFMTNPQHLTSITHHPSDASPPAPLRMERGVIPEIPLYVLQMFSSSSPIISRLIGVTSHTTPLSIRRGAGGEASVNSVCRRRSVGSKLCA